MTETEGCLVPYVTPVIFRLIWSDFFGVYYLFLSLRSGGFTELKNLLAIAFSFARDYVGCSNLPFILTAEFEFSVYSAESLIYSIIDLKSISLLLVFSSSYDFL